MTVRRVLVVMAKAPRPGHVKTRLAPRLTSEQAARLYECLLRDTLEVARQLGGVDVALMCPPGDRSDLAALVDDPRVDVAAQVGEGLAAGLASVFLEFAGRGFNRIVAFNADSPHLPAACLAGAFASLDTYDTVVGPTADGGYYLIGATGAHAGLFEGDRLGTAGALEALMARLRKLSLSVGMLPAWYDVDVPDDLARLARDLRAEPARAPRTAALLASWRASCDA